MSPYGAYESGRPSSSNSTFVERVGLAPRIPIFGLKPKPSSSRTLTPAILRNASEKLNTRAFSSSRPPILSIEPGISPRLSVVPARYPEATETSAAIGTADSSISILLLAPEPSRTSRILVPNVSAITSIRYVPAARSENRNFPDASVSVSRSKRTPTLETLTRTPATAEPCSSLTLPPTLASD